MKTFLRCKNHKPRKLPAAFRGQDVRYADELVATFLQRYTRPGDLVFDPFAGFGTTLLVAETLGRNAAGIEYDPERVAYIRGLLRNPQTLIHGDSRQLAQYALPAIDFSMTSPPFMERWDPEDPFTNYGQPGRGYEAYLSDLQQIYRQLTPFLNPGARAVLEVANLKSDKGVTMLAWDVARVVGEVLPFEGEVVITWDHYGYGYDHSYCLIFRKPAEA